MLIAKESSFGSEKKIQKELVTLNYFRYEYSKELFLKYLITNKIGTENPRT